MTEYSKWKYISWNNPYTNFYFSNITKPSANSNMRKNFYSLRIVNDWNKLPTDTKEAPSLEVFKNTVNEILFAEQNNSVD